MPRKGETNHKDATGHRFGELVVVARVGTIDYGRGSRCSQKCPIYSCICAKMHLENRSRNSLRVTGDRTQCKACRRERLAFRAGK